MTGHCEHCRQDCWGDEDGFHSNTGETVQWDAGHCPTCAERAAIVAWLRDSFFKAGGPTFADLIERCEHLRDPE